MFIWPNNNFYCDIWFNFTQSFWNGCSPSLRVYEPLVRVTYLYPSSVHDKAAKVTKTCIVIIILVIWILPLKIWISRSGVAENSCSGMWRCFVGWAIPDVWKERIVFNLKVQAVEFGQINPADEYSDPSKHRELLTQRQHSIQEDLNLQATPQFLTVWPTLCWLSLFYSIRPRIKVLFITPTLVCSLNDVWRSRNLVHFCEAQICYAPVVTREMSATITCEDGVALWLIKCRGIRVFCDRF